MAKAKKTAPVISNTAVISTAQIAAREKAVIANVDASLERAIMELTTLQQDLKDGKKPSLGRMNMVSHVLKGLGEVAGAW